MSRRQERQFGFLLATVFTLVAFWPLWPLRAPAWPWLAPAALSALVAIVAPSALGPLFRLWMAFGHALGWVSSRIVLTVVFFLIVTPIGVIRRLLGRDSLGLRGARESYWITRASSETTGSMRNQF